MNLDAVKQKVLIPGCLYNSIKKETNLGQRNWVFATNSDFLTGWRKPFMFQIMKSVLDQIVLVWNIKGYLKFWGCGKYSILLQNCKITCEIFLKRSLKMRKKIRKCTILP